MAAAAVRVLTWNLLHGRAVPGRGRDLFDEFAAELVGWAWDVALLQEVPPWWPTALAARLDADQRHVLTSRNALLPLRRAIAVRWPDLIKSNGGGANAILVRGERIVEHRVLRLSRLPERRWVHAVRLADGLWAGNLHAAADARQGVRAAEALLEWAGGAAAVLGGDFNVRKLTLRGFAWAGGSGPDHVYVTGGLTPVGDARVLKRGSLSDHAPLLATVMRVPE
jgi:endonuclease/exonuclease/phosphatase family metal-dependent hydrolase